jgi:hypothetical protein
MLLRALLSFAVLALAAPPLAAQSTPAGAPADLETEKAAIRQVVMDAYVNGMFVRADAEAVRKGWHPGCDIVSFQNGGLVKMPAHNFARRFDRQPKPLDTQARAEFTSITVSGYAAVAILELKSGDRPVYTDMLSLYKFDDGWKIVTKIFYSYPAPAASPSR